MELPISFAPANKFVKQLHHYTETVFAPFLRENSTLNNDDFIMPLYLVEKKLHDHYVSMTPLLVTYEYYDRNHRIHQTTVLITVKSTVRPDRRIVLNELNQNRSLILDLEQILTVSANIG